MYHIFQPTAKKRSLCFCLQIISTTNKIIQYFMKLATKRKIVHFWHIKIFHSETSSNSSFQQHFVRSFSTLSPFGHFMFLHCFFSYQHFLMEFLIGKKDKKWTKCKMLFQYSQCVTHSFGKWSHKPVRNIWSRLTKKSTHLKEPAWNRHYCQWALGKV